MTVQLSQPDFLQLTRIVQNLPDFANVRDRTDLVAEALAHLTVSVLVAVTVRVR